MAGGNEGSIDDSEYSHYYSFGGHVEETETTPTQLAILIIVLLVFAALFSTILFYLTKRVESKKRAEGEERQENIGKDLVKSLPAKKWSIDETVHLSDTDSCSSQSGDEAATTSGTSSSPTDVPFGSSNGAAAAATENNNNKATAAAAAVRNKNDHLHTCQICAVDFIEGDPILQSNNPSCQHLFHQNCIEKWMKYQYSCPVCNERFVLHQV